MMMMVRVSPAALEQFGKLQRRVQERVVAAIERLQATPGEAGVEKLRVRSKAFWFRLRTGDHRVHFRSVIIHDEAGETIGFRADVDCIGHRRDLNDH